MRSEFHFLLLTWSPLGAGVQTVTELSPSQNLHSAVSKRVNNQYILKTGGRVVCGVLDPIYINSGIGKRVNLKHPAASPPLISDPLTEELIREKKM